MATRSGRPYQTKMSLTNKFDLVNLKEVLSSVDDINAHVRKRIELENSGRGITPHLARDGSNFNLWYHSLSNLIDNLYDLDTYFGEASNDNNKSRDREIQIFIRKSIHQELLLYTEGLYSARSIFQSLQKRFQHKLLSQAMVILNRTINLNEANVSLDEGFSKMQSLLRKLKSSLGSVWTDDSLLAMFFHQFNKAQFHHIANALNAKEYIDLFCIITAWEVLQVAQRFQPRDETKTDANVMAFPASRGQPNNMSRQHYPPQISRQTDASNKSRADNKPSRYPHPSMQSAAWATKWLSPKHPCSHCFEWGHWAMDCLRKPAGKPPIEDPKKRDATFRYHKSKFVSHPTLVSVKAKLTSIQATTEDSNTASSSRHRDNQIVYPEW
ncbi:hypothetical protein O181_070045 [Austropuccinia psidii MF-1]|uniref:CCHC-type domain-containing protein n=1 Tax=Austropuccinia psidii MF-1 TaxID=1389203 RepID=A0A9Q3F420_9BASI|nr:hypothetical protein [Austropuccinia psidii MF-1]